MSVGRGTSGGSVSSTSPISLSALSSGWNGCLVLSSSFRTKRWAMTNLMADTNNGFCPMTSIMRVKAAAALEAWKVDNTKWPVSEACNAVLAVSISRISPTMTISGSSRNTARNLSAKLVSPADLLLTEICDIPWNWYSTGSSIVIILRSSEFSEFNIEYSVVVLPEPVGPTTSTSPLGLAIMSSTTCRSTSDSPSRSRLYISWFMLNSRMTISMPFMVGTVSSRRLTATSVPSAMRTFCDIWPCCASGEAVDILPALAMAETSTRYFSTLSTAIECRTPSILKRIRTFEFWVSRWMSDAASLWACCTKYARTSSARTCSNVAEICWSKFCEPAALMDMSWYTTCRGGSYNFMYSR